MGDVEGTWPNLMDLWKNRQVKQRPKKNSSSSEAVSWVELNSLAAGSLLSWSKKLATWVNDCFDLEGLTVAAAVGESGSDNFYASARIGQRR